MDSTETRALMDRFHTALGKGDVDTLLEILADDIVWQPPESAPIEPIHGKAAVAQAFGRDIVRQTFDLSQPFELERGDMIVDGNRAVVQQRIIATAKATGLPYDNKYCWIYTCADGKIAAMDEYADTMIAARSMGWDAAG
jgi:uncharacterized protein